MLCDIIREIQQGVVKAGILEFRRWVRAGAVELKVFNILVAFKIMDDSHHPQEYAHRLRTDGGHD